MNHIYQVIMHYADGESKVVYETANREEAYEYCEQANHLNEGFTYSYYDVDC